MKKRRFLSLLLPAPLGYHSEQTSSTAGEKCFSLNAILTPCWKLQQASLKENEMIASLKVCKQGQTSSTVTLTPYTSDG